MHSKLHTISLNGLSGDLVEVEVFITNGLPRFEIVGLASRAVQEAKERVFAAIKSSGYDFPLKRILVNLAPSDLSKTGTGYDLPIAVAILLASSQLKVPTRSTIYWGELSLEGQIRDTNGGLAIALAAKEYGFTEIITSRNNASIAVNIAGINVKSLDSIAEIENPDAVIRSRHGSSTAVNSIYPDFADIVAQGFTKRALQIAAIGRHNILMFGTPGAGKTHMAKAFAGILPDMSLKEQIEVATIYNIAGLNRGVELINPIRPFRSPHHTCSNIALIGGGARPKPGEITLAHNGVLFLDEFQEFDARSLEGLRQPLQDKSVLISRVQGSTTYPADFQLIAAMNPCKCGYHGDSVRECLCSSYDILKYKKKISGPLLDRIDMQVFVPRLALKDMHTNNKGDSSTLIKDRVLQAIYFKKAQKKKDLDNRSRLKLSDKRYLISYIDKLALSQRAYNSIIKISRSIADLEFSETIQLEHIQEALTYRVRAI